MRTCCLTLAVCAGTVSCFTIGAGAQTLPPGAFIGPSTGVQPYTVPSNAATGVKFYSIATNGRGGPNVDPDETYPNLSGGVYRLLGIPDGSGAFVDEGDTAAGQFTWLVNHENGSTTGLVRRHGSVGCTVSYWKIKGNPGSPDFLTVVGGEDLIALTNVWQGGAYVQQPTAMGRFCSGDLALPGAYRFGALGTDARIYMNGEENGANGRAFAHIASGAAKGVSYELPRHGDYSWENSVASPFPQEKTVVIGADDSTPGNVYVYVGTKTATGTDVERAGLTNGTIYALVMSGTTVTAGQNVEDQTNILGNAGSGPVASKAFTMLDMSAVFAANGLTIETATGAQLQSLADANGQMNFRRPEDVCWDLMNRNVAYFVTTAAVGTSSRLWKMEFADITHPELGGTITMLLDGTNVVGTASGGFNSATGATTVEMMDQICITPSGLIYIQEDVGNNARLGRTWRYNTADDSVVEVGINNANFFVSGASHFLTQDEEASGIIDARDVIGPGWLLLDMQAHYSISVNGLVEGGQLMAMYDPAAVALCKTDIGATGGTTGGDGRLDNNDFVVFIDYFFAHNPLADVGIQGGIPGTDNAWDNNDFVVYIDAFFRNCGF
ncbi:MAG TPA: GC-type dockerin domain-anchored protein [Phycisphaerales bacterium]|nr:GC-type dockerin domain-anchored protein [Phycisphaerales bacterium]